MEDSGTHSHGAHDSQVNQTLPCLCAHLPLFIFHEVFLKELLIFYSTQSKCSSPQRELCGKSCLARKVTCQETDIPRWPTGWGYYKNKYYNLSLSFVTSQGSPLAKSSGSQKTKQPIDVGHKVSLHRVYNRSAGKIETFQQCLYVCVGVCMHVCVCV